MKIVRDRVNIVNIKILIDGSIVNINHTKNINYNLLNGNDWRWWLSKYPQLSIYCNWNKLDDIDWYWLLYYQPQFKKYKYE